MAYFPLSFSTVSLYDELFFIACNAVHLDNRNFKGISPKVFDLLLEECYLLRPLHRDDHVFILGSFSTLILIHV